MDEQAQMALIVRYLDAYADLALSDLYAAGRRCRAQLWTALALAGAALMAVAMACGLIVALTWNTAGRAPALAGLTLVFSLAALGAFLGLRTLVATAPAVLAVTAQEWRKDRLLLAQYLGRSPGDAP